MKRYPSVDKKIQHIPVWMFDKLDGSNIRVEWTRKNGLSKFGSRNQLIDSTSFLGESIELIKEHENTLDNVFRKKLRLNKATCFFEFFGENSFAGNHYKEKHKVVLLDVFVYKKGIIQANEFIKLFGDRVPTPNFLHRGYVGSEIVEQIKQNNFDGMTFEGVICKGKMKKNMGFPPMFKIKSNGWLDKLRDYCGDDNNLFERLV
jgi:hypothetical protein